MSSSNVIEIYITPHQFFAEKIDLQSNTSQNTKRLKRYLMFLLSQINITHSFTTGPNDRLFIEVYPDKIGGANVRFIIEQENKSLFRTTIFCFEDSDSLIDVAIKLLSIHGHRIFKSDIYKCNDLWLLIIQFINSNNSTASILMSEYGLLISDKIEVYASIKEHCTPVLIDQAVETISFYFS